ncbi:hypothetical protein [Paenilisteria rocourtiae]|uniref:Uncharacterized protein n=1 Tax=Listeria rocourtiae TaxID=647910 RepID=A0A4R6ZMP0_9LIST|nr:hypothetical protein [Listeria rocourtiae]MBC1434438.1 hypothetical protein [Listeria rocourtiae]MBC1603902.1 hypothetical protein [Listeria rocourtiae]TDR53592.1 hypothetical protein DFP96_104184 [Listeria rocourtiae]
MKKLVVTGAVLGSLLLGLSGYFVYQLQDVVIGAGATQVDMLQAVQK